MKISVGVLIVLVNLFAVVVFAFIYMQIKDRLTDTVHPEHQVSWIDCLQLSSTIQASIGYTPLQPNDSVAKSVIILQTIVMITLTTATIGLVLR